MGWSERWPGAEGADKSASAAGSRCAGMACDEERREDCAGWTRGAIVCGATGWRDAERRGARRRGDNRLVPPVVVAFGSNSWRRRRTRRRRWRRRRVRTSRARSFGPRTSWTPSNEGTRLFD